MSGITQRRDALFFTLNNTHWGMQNRYEWGNLHLAVREMPRKGEPMEVGWILTLFAIGFAGSLISGMVGIGGSIIKYPMLLYIPPALGFIAFTAQEVSAVSAVQVFFASLAGIFAFRKAGFINKSLVLYMGGAIVAGSFIGGYGSKFLPDEAINLTYAILALIAAVMMFLPKKGDETADFTKLQFNKPLAAIDRKSTRLNSSHIQKSRMPSSA